MEQIGKYAIVGQIGTGGFGVVYEGRDPFLKRRVAIKTCSSEESDIRDRFFREAEIAGNLQHRNIVTVHDFGVQDGVPYLVQEYLTGEDLDRVVARRDPLSPAQRVDILVQAARGLEYAHEHGVIHRDIKPANIRLTSEGVVRIMDFGIAKLSNVASHLTRTGMTLGTAAYLPPEQIRGTTVDHRADIFSFGVTAYELLTYHRPFVGKTISALFWELLQREPEPLTNFWPACPPALEQVVMRCLAKDPNRRYASFTELIPELEEVLADLQQARRRGRELAARGEEPTAQQPSRPPRPEGTREPAAPAHAPPTALPPTLPATPRPPRPRAGERFEAAATAVRKAQGPETAGLLNEVEEALAGARAATVARKARELLGSGDLEGAERELAEVPEKAGVEVAVVRRDVARARADRLLAQAAAQWQQGAPQAALVILDQLLAAAPGHGDALRLRDTWRAELAERERAQAAAAAETSARRAGIVQAVAEAEALLMRGDVDDAEAVVAAAQANFGSHQPLRDLRRRIGLARDSSPSYSLLPMDVKTDVSTLGVAPGSVAAARQRADAEAGREAAPPSSAPPSGPPAARRGVSATAWPRPGATPARPPTPAPAPASLPPRFGTGPPLPTSAAANDDTAHRTRLLLIAIGAAAVVALVLIALWIAFHRRQPAAQGPSPGAAPSAVPSSFGVGLPTATAPPPPRAADRDATVLQTPTAAYPAGVPRRAAVVRLDVLVSAEGVPLEARTHPGTVVEDPRLVAEAQRVAKRSRYLPALRGGVPAESWIVVEVEFRPR